VQQKIDIEKLLHWAYRDQLPKGYRDGKGGASPEISPMFRYANLGGPVDNWSKEPGFPIAMGTEPHPDALRVHFAAMMLDDVVIQWPSAAEALLGDLFQYMTDEEKFSVCKLHVQVAGLVTLHSRMGNRPIWHLDYNIRRVIGRDRKALIRKARGRRSRNLQGEVRLDVPASEILTARFEYFAWHSGLCELAAKLGDLQEHQPLKPSAPQQPWFHPDQARVLSDRGGMDARALATKRLSAGEILPLKPRRKRVLPQEPTGRHGPVRYLSVKEKDVC
jgi:hypothetical protein